MRRVAATMLPNKPRMPSSLGTLRAGHRSDLAVNGTDEDRHPAHAGHDLSDQLQPFGTEIGVQRRDAGDVAAGSGQARDEPGANWVDRVGEDDRDGRGGFTPIGWRVWGAVYVGLGDCSPSGDSPNSAKTGAYSQVAESGRSTVLSVKTGVGIVIFLAGPRGA
jgi:hypothetical protein